MLESPVHFFFFHSAPIFLGLVLSHLLALHVFSLLAPLSSFIFCVRSSQTTLPLHAVSVHRRYRPSPLYHYYHNVDAGSRPLKRRPVLLILSTFVSPSPRDFRGRLRETTSDTVVSGHSTKQVLRPISPPSRLHCLFCHDRPVHPAWPSLSIHHAHRPPATHAPIVRLVEQPWEIYNDTGSSSSGRSCAHTTTRLLGHAAWLKNTL